MEKQIQTAHGMFALNAHTDAKMAARLAQKVFPQQEVIDVVLACRAERVVDVGAHIGTVSIPLAKLGKTIVAFEPNPESFRYLTSNAERNGVLVDARNKGLADTPGRASIITVQASNAGAHSLGTGDSVEISTLDTEVRQADFIKIDVEGMELAVLEGGNALIEHSRPVVYFEVNLSALRAHAVTPAALGKFFKARKYRLYFFEHETLYTLPGLTFTSLLVAPRSALFGAASAPFDVVALPARTPVPYTRRSRAHTVLYLLTRYVKLQYARFFH